MLASAPVPSPPCDAGRPLGTLRPLGLPSPAPSDPCSTLWASTLPAARTWWRRECVHTYGGLHDRSGTLPGHFLSSTSEASRPQELPCLLWIRWPATSEEQTARPQQKSAQEAEGTGFTEGSLNGKHQGKHEAYIDHPHKGSARKQVLQPWHTKRLVVP